MGATHTPAGSALERLLKKDRRLVATGLVVICALSWLYLVVLARDMASMEGMAGMDMASMDGTPGTEALTDEEGMAGRGPMAPGFEPWTASDWVFMFLMWAVMMVAMMIPSATPMILLFAAVNRKEGQGTWPRVALFVSGYLLVWTAFSAVATVVQWALERAALLSPMMVTTSGVLGGALLVACAVYQLSPWKNACLEHCRSPVHFVMHHWRPGSVGALRMGVEHGLFCVGCCWVLMALLFVGGVMNLLWIAAIGGFVLLEKVTPRPEWVSRGSGLLFLVAGLVLLFR